MVLNFAQGREIQAWRPPAAAERATGPLEQKNRPKGRLRCLLSWLCCFGSQHDAEMGHPGTRQHKQKVFQVSSAAKSASPCITHLLCQNQE